MSVVREPEMKWSPEKMVEVLLNEPDDFSKLEKLSQELVWQVGKRRRYIKVATYFISKGGIILSTLKNFLLLMENTLTLLLMMFSVGIVLLSFSC